MKKTPLHAMHLAAGARMVEFAGWELPLRYGGLIDEHLAVRTRAGLFDVSHMGEISVRGPQALALLQRVTCNDVSRLQPGRAHYTALTTPGGAFVDDLLVYQLAPDDYLLVVNAANAAKDQAWLAEHAAPFDARVRDVSDDWAQLALQGPAAAPILQPLVEAPLARLRYYGFVRAEVEGASCLISRTGYTGEDGFEIYVPVADATRVWQAVVAAGGPHGLSLVGLGARDTLRLEARMALYGNDIDQTTTVLEADLGWIVKLDKGDFIGREVLARQAAGGVQRRLVGFEMRGRAVARHGHAVLADGREVGRVTSGSHAPFLRRNIGLAYLPVEHGASGTEIAIDIRGRAEPAVVVPTPFYRRPR
jgi:aminomethyltransferase